MIYLLERLYIILKKAVESTTSDYCTDSARIFDDFLLLRMGDTVSAKNHQKFLRNQHISHSRYDSTAFSRIIFCGYKFLISCREICAHNHGAIRSSNVLVGNSQNINLSDNLII